MSCKESFSNSDGSILTLSAYPNLNNGQFMIDLTLSIDEDQPATIPANEYDRASILLRENFTLPGYNEKRNCH